MKTKLVSSDQSFMVILEKQKDYNQVDFAIFRTMQMEQDGTPVTFESEKGSGGMDKFEDELTDEDALMSGWYQYDLTMNVNFRKNTVHFSRPEDIEQLAKFLKEIEQKLQNNLLPGYKPIC